MGALKRGLELPYKLWGAWQERGGVFERGWYPDAHYECWVKILLLSLLVGNVLKETTLTYISFTEGLGKCHSFNFCFSCYTVGAIIPEEILKWGGHSRLGKVILRRVPNKMRWVLKFSNKWNLTPQLPPPQIPCH